MSSSCTVRISKIPFTAVAEELVEFLESNIGSNTVFACKIHTEKLNWKSKGFGFVQFETEVAAIEAVELARKCKLRFQQRVLHVELEQRHLVDRPQIRFHATSLHIGELVTAMSEFCSFWCAKVSVTVELDRTKGKLALVFENASISTRYMLTWKLTSLEISGTQNESGQSYGAFLLLQVKFAPKIRRQVKKNSLKRGKEFVNDRFTFFRDSREDKEHVWCRCGDFTEKGFIAQSSAYCLEIPPTEKHLYRVFTDTLSNAHAFQEFGDIVLRAGECTNHIQDKLLIKLQLAKLDKGLIQMNRLIVTPTKEYLLGPETEVSNRVTRHYEEIIGNFLRVCFVDEDMSSLSARALEIAPDRFLETRVRSERTEIYYRIRKILDEGITIGGKKYEFLAFSSSQLREHSVWMFASDQVTTCDSIRSWMGNFSNFRNVASCAARMGQCFSASKQGPEVHEDEIKEIPDIERLSGGVKYCFSDGIGKISPLFAAEIAMKCSYESKWQEALAPSAFQIRYGGYKGVVAIDPSSSGKLYLRPSMKKFHSNHTALDVLEWTRFLPCYLNRQVITLLSTLGVEDHVFESMQGERLSSLDGVMGDREEAMKMLRSSYGGDYHNMAVQMLLSGYHPEDEPFLFSMLQAFKSAQIQQICKKSKIFVPKGRVLMGCLDEYGCLDYGQVFVKVSSLEGGGASVIKRTVVVTKNPCLHPGDIRVLQAVDLPDLQHMVDCIVFPQKGTRPHPNECSGSDLDGDLYFVAWDERLVPPTVEVPMDYYPPNSIILDHLPSLEEIHTYFVDYMSNDSLGAIANAHVVFADQEPEKARSQKCIKLADLASIAVDFPKTGVPAILPKDLRPHSYPDFMEKSGKKSYISSGVIGKLYRAAKTLSRNASIRHAKELGEYYDHDLVVNGFEKHVERALVYKILYDEKITALMELYGVQNEAELMTGVFSELRPTLCNTSKKVEDRIHDAVAALKGEARSWFKDMQTSGDDPNQEYAIASAWYNVTYNPKFHGKHLLSFPWVNYDKLLQIKRYMKLSKTMLNKDNLD